MMEAKMYDALYESMEAQLWLGKKSTKPGHKEYWIKTGQFKLRRLQLGHAA